MMLLWYTIHTLCLNSVVEGFEMVADSLVGNVNFTDVELVEDRVAVNGRRVSQDVVVILHVLLHVITIKYCMYYC